MSDLNEAGDTGFDLDSSMDTIASGMGLDGVEPPERNTPDAGATTVTTPDPALEPIAPPKSWAKEMHEHWGKMPRQAQEYYQTREKQMLDGLEQYKGDAGFARELREVITPYKAMIQAQGVSEREAVGYLLNAHYRLTQGSPEERQAFYRQLGEDLGFVTAPADPNAPPPDPAVQRMQQEVSELKAERQREQQTRERAARENATKETNAFASDPANVHFNEVAPDMVLLVKQGLSLKDAYDKAVWMNPVTRAKEQARLQTEAAAKLKEQAKTEAEAARKATSTNVRGAETRRAPTEPKGSMEDTMRETLKKIRDRAH